MFGLLVDCPHHSSFPCDGQRSVTFTTIVWNGPVKAGENGSLFAVTAKQRPHASPGPSPGPDPNASWLTAAVKPDAGMPHAVPVDGQLGSLSVGNTRRHAHLAARTRSSA